MKEHRTIVYRNDNVYIFFEWGWKTTLSDSWNSPQTTISLSVRGGNILSLRPFGTTGTAAEWEASRWILTLLYYMSRLWLGDNSMLSNISTAAWLNKHSSVTAASSFHCGIFCVKVRHASSWHLGQLTVKGTWIQSLVVEEVIKLRHLETKKCP